MDDDGWWWMMMDDDGWWWMMMDDDGWWWMMDVDGDLGLCFSCTCWHEQILRELYLSHFRKRSGWIGPAIHIILYNNCKMVLPNGKWTIIPVTSGLSPLTLLPTGILKHLQSGMSLYVPLDLIRFPWSITRSDSVWWALKVRALPASQVNLWLLNSWVFDDFLRMHAWRPPSLPPSAKTAVALPQHFWPASSSSGILPSQPEHVLTDWILSPHLPGPSSHLWRGFHCDSFFHSCHFGSGTPLALCYFQLFHAPKKTVFPTHSNQNNPATMNYPLAN